ncbi:MAG: nucleotide exchange factor GrpE [Lachnospiraceae bacterium]|nr:nucleotide exchange factor GrpE [Lachnospiraceae bacterium]
MEEDRIMDVQEENLTEPAEEKPDSEDIEVSAENEEAETAEAEPAEAEEADGEEPQPEEPSEETEGGTEEEKKGFFSRKKDKEKAALKQRVGELEDRVMRQMAEFDNFRKRTDKEKDQMFSMGEKNVLEKLLPIIDNFERGFDSVQPEDEEDAFVQGMRKIYAQLVKQMEDIGVTPIDAAGKEFDPNLHNAVMQVESEEYPSGTVAQELLKGYMFHDTVLRHSMVSVVS